MIELTLPDLAGLADSATIAEWDKAPGDWVQRDEVICRVILAGQEMEVHSTADGYLEQHLVAVGAAVRGGDALAELEQPGETRLRAVPEQAPAWQGQPPAFAAPAASRPRADEVSPAVAALAAERGVDLSRVRGTGIGGRIRAQDVLAHVDPLNQA
jgi:pyruvate/2-oxoglutarate dehydrogenase complex dihydrolipoamide acyltransferase (E2) component